MRTPMEQQGENDSEGDSVHHVEEDEVEEEEGIDEEEEEVDDEEDEGTSPRSHHESLTLDVEELEEDPLETAVYQLAQDVVTTEWADDELTTKLNMIAEALEEAEAAFRKERTPPYRREGNLIGNLLQVLEQQDEFYAILEAKLGELTPPRVKAAVCRVLLATASVNSRFLVRLLYDEDTLDRICEYAADAPPLRGYATGLLAVGLRDRSIADIVVNKEVAVKFLQRIRLYASKLERERLQATKYIHDHLKASAVGGRRRGLSFSGPAVRGGSSTAHGLTQRLAGLKRKFSETTLRTTLDRSASEGDVGTQGTFTQDSLDDASGERPVGDPSSSSSTIGGGDEEEMIQRAASDLLGFSPDPDWHEEELKRLVLLELLYTLDCIGLMGEYMELFAPALKEDIVGTIITFLHSTNPSVVAHILKLTSHFLAHKKFCFSLLDVGGVALIFATAKALQGRSQLGSLDPSLSMCLHGLASSSAVMEKVLLVDADTLLPVSFRLLSSAHDRARQNAVVFFGLTLSFKVVLEYFEKENGLYHLLNIIRAGNTPKSAVQRQLSHDASLCLRQYLRVHMALVTHKLRRRLAQLHHPPTHRSSTTGTPVLTAAPPALSRLPVRVPKLHTSKPVDIDDKTHEQNLVFYEKYQFSVPSTAGSSSSTTTPPPWSAASGPGGSMWPPAAKLSHLRGPLVMLEVMAMLVALLKHGEADDANATTVRVWIVERAQFCLECLRILTLVVPSLASDVCSTEVTMDEQSQKISGLSILLETAMSSHARDAGLVRDALYVFCNCVAPPHADDCWQHPHKDIRQFTLTARDMRQPPSPSAPLTEDDGGAALCCARVRDDKAQRPVRKLARAKNAIKVCVQLLQYKRSVQNADAIRLLATRALLGLARDRHIAQILETMQLGHVLSDLIRHDPVLEENADLHVRFRESALDLISLVTHRAPNAVINEATDPTVRKIEKASIVAQTPITYDQKELLGLIHSHLVAKGLKETAAALVRESQLSDASCNAEKGRTTAHKTSPTIGPGRLNPLDVSTAARAMTETLWEGPRPSKIPRLTLLPPASSIEPVKPDHGRRRESTAAVRRLPHGERRKRVRKAFASPHWFALQPQTRSLSTVEPPIPPHTPSRLDAIITHYLREQHRQCANPVTTVPPFKLLDATAYHRCPDPSTLSKTPVNICSRLLDRSRSHATSTTSAHADAGVNRYVFSRYRPYRIVGNHGSSALTHHWGPSVARFYGDDQRELLLGNHDGLLQRLHIDTEHIVDEWTCHPSSSAIVALAANDATRVASQAHRLLLTGAVALTPFGVTEVALWDVASMQEPHWRFAGGLSPRFNHYGDRLVALDARRGTDQYDVEGDRDRLVVGAVVIDVTTGAAVAQLRDSVQSNGYGHDTNCAYALDDQTILTGGLLWDVRSPTRPITKFDKLSNVGYGCFHPNGNEVLINSAVWDLRTYQLLRMVPALDKCTVQFNATGAVLFAYSPHSMIDAAERRRIKAKTWFRVLEARDYKEISTVELQRPLYDVVVDQKSTFLATIEGRYLDAATSIEDDPLCRLYEIGRKRPSEDDSDVEDGQDGSEAMDEDEFDDESEEEDDDDEEEDDEDDEDDEEEEEDDEYDDEEDDDDGIEYVGGSEEEGEEGGEEQNGPALSVRDIHMLFELPQDEYYDLHDDYTENEQDEE